MAKKGRKTTAQEAQTEAPEAAEETQSADLIVYATANPGEQRSEVFVEVADAGTALPARSVRVAFDLSALRYRRDALSTLRTILSRLENSPWPPN